MQRLLPGGDPVSGSDRLLGQVTGTKSDSTVEKQLAYGYRPAAHAMVGTAVGVEYFGSQHAAMAVAEPLFDASGKRLKG